MKKRTVAIAALVGMCGMAALFCWHRTRRDRTGNVGTGDTLSAQADFENNIGKLLDDEPAEYLHSKYVGKMENSLADGLFLAGLTKEAELVQIDDYKGVMDMYRQAAEAGSRDARFRLRLLGLSGQADGGLQRSTFDSIPTTDIGDMAQACLLAAKIDTGRDQASDIREAAMKLVERAVHAEIPEGYYAKGRTLIAAGQKSAEGLELLRTASKQGVILADLVLARLYAENTYIPAQDGAEGKYLRQLASALGYGLNQQEDGVTETSLAPEVVQRIFSTLKEGEYWGNSRCSLALVVLAATANNYNVEGHAKVQARAISAFSTGSPEVCLYAALAADRAGFSSDRGQWLERGETSGDWRCVYAAELLKDQTPLRTALGRAVTANFPDYQHYLSAKANDATLLDPVPLNVSVPKLEMHGRVGKNNQIAVVNLYVNTDGRASLVEITECDDPMVAAELKKAAKQWRFRPAMKNGRSVVRQVQLPIYKGMDE